MTFTLESCAREILEVTPLMMQALRTQMRAQRLHDLSVPQFRTLAFLNHQPGSSLSAAAEHIGLTLPTMSVLVEGLVQRGLVDRLPDPRDRRRVLLKLTEQGYSQQQAALDGAAAGLTELLAPLSAADRTVVMQAFATLRPLFAGAGIPTGGKVDDQVKV